MANPLRVLIVEDSESDTILLVRYLEKNNYQVTFERVSSATECNLALEREVWDIVIADYALPGFGGLGALDICREKGLDLPFIIVSGTIGEDIAVEAMKAGAHDYVMKGSFARLVQAIQRELREAQVRKERRRAEEALQESAANYQTLFEHSPAALIFIEDDLTISLANKEFQKLSGYSNLELDGKKKWTEFIANNEDLKRMKEYHRLRRIDPVAAPATYEFKFVDRNGLLKDIVITVAMVPGTRKSLGALLDITQRKRVEEDLRASLKEKEFLLLELNHRVNNNLQLISNLMRLHRKHITDKAALAVFDQSQNSIRSIALVHEKLYRSKSFYNVNLREYISELARDIFAAYVSPEKEIKLELNFEDVKLDIERIISCGLIINELLSNSLKYAFPGKTGGKISISVRYAQKGVIELIYKDSGIGIPDDFDVRNASTLGMQLVFNLAEKQLDGSVELERKDGIAFKVLFKEIQSDGM